MAKKKVTIETIKKNYRRSRRFDNKWRKQAEEDLRFCLGEQWDKQDKETVEKKGRPALTLNIIQPNIRLITGFQRESRSSIKAYPEGREDELASEIATKLLKNVHKRSHLDMIISEAFETSLMARGKAFIEPYIDYTYDLLNGTMQFNVLDGWNIRIDPNSVKYDLSDARYIIKERKLTEDDMAALFPDKEDLIKEIKNLAFSDNDEIPDEDSILEENEDYPKTQDMDKSRLGEDEEDTFKFIEYFYKKWISHYLAIDVKHNIAQMFPTKKQAEAHLIEARQAERPNAEVKSLTRGQKVIERKIPQIWVASIIGQTIVEDKVNDAWPNWKGYPFIPYFAWYYSAAKRVLKKEELAYQGFASSLKDPQMEKNKRRSQALHIVNSMASSGWLSEEDSWVKPKDVKHYGSTPGVNLFYKTGKPKPERIQPAIVPQSHIYFEEKSEEDIKLISGVNADMLSVQDKTTSGRALAIRERIGVRILKPLFDNLSFTQELLGKYMVSQLAELYTVDKAIRVLGGDFIDKSFRKNEEDTPEIIMGAASNFIAALLNDQELTNYDIEIGEGLESPTERLAQFLSMLEMAKEGIPIPPQVLIEHSDMPESAKKATLAAMQTSQSDQEQNNKSLASKKRRKKT